MRRGLVVVGNTSRDTVKYQTMSRGPFFGGGGLNVAIAASSAGIFPKLVSVIGCENKSLLKRLSKYIDTTAIRCVSGKTCQFELIYNQNGLLQDVNYEFGVSGLLNEHFESLPLSRLYYHVSCRTPLNPEPVLNRLVKHNRKFSLDFIASSIKRQIDQAGEWIIRADCVFLNTKEFDVFSNVIDPAKMRRIVVTSAALPVRVFENGRLILEKSCPKVGFYDVTGAGDAFVGAFLANYLHGRTLSTTVEGSIKIAQMSLMGLGVWGLLPHDK